jgi:hypothetical protein
MLVSAARANYPFCGFSSPPWDNAAYRKLILFAGVTVGARAVVILVTVVLLVISGRARARPGRAAGEVRTGRGLRGAVPRLEPRQRVPAVLPAELIRWLDAGHKAGDHLTRPDGRGIQIKSVVSTNGV